MCVLSSAWLYLVSSLCAHTKPDSLSAAQSVALEGERERKGEVETGSGEGTCSDE